MDRYIDEDCPCAPLHIKCEYDGHDCVGCALHRLNYALHNALNTATGGIIKPYHCPMFKPRNG